MSTVTVHNISDRSNCPYPAQAYTVARRTVRPGKSVSVDSSELGDKILKLHDGPLWFGKLPKRYSDTSQSSTRSAVATEQSGAMTLEEARAYLRGLSKAKLLDLCTWVAPPLEFTIDPPQELIAWRLGRVLFLGRFLDPEKFFWLGRWRRVGDSFVEKE